MPIVNLGNQSIGGGATVNDLKFDVVTKQLSTRQEAERVIIGKPLVESGDRGITTNAIFSVRGTQPSHMFGIKQVAVVRGLTAEFSGLKSIDGSITEGTSTLNFTPILDLAVFADVAAGVMSAPHAPFYAERPAFVRPGAQAQLEVKDSPGGSFPFEKRNHVTDRLNFLDSVGQATDFVTFLVVQLPNATHFAIAGFRWTFSASVNVVWTNGKPAATGTARHDFQTSATRADLSPGELGILENPRLGFGDSVVARVNRAKSAADASHVTSPIGPTAPAKIEGGGYAIEQFDRFNNAVVNNRKTA